MLSHRVTSGSANKLGQHFLKVTLFSYHSYYSEIRETLLAGCLINWAHIPVQIFVVFLNYILPSAVPKSSTYAIKGKPTKYVKDLHLSLCTATRGGEAAPRMSALWYESCDNDEKLIDFYLYQSDDHRPCYFYYFLRRGLVLHEYEGIYSQHFLDL